MLEIVSKNILNICFKLYYRIPLHSLINLITPNVGNSKSDDNTLCLFGGRRVGNSIMFRISLPVGVLSSLPKSRRCSQNKKYMVVVRLVIIDSLLMPLFEFEEQLPYDGIRRWIMGTGKTLIAFLQMA